MRGSNIKYFGLQNFQHLALGLSIFLFTYPSFTWEHITLITPVAALLLLLACLLEFVGKNTLQFPSFLPLLLFLSYNVYISMVGISVNTSVFTTPVLVTLMFFTFSKETVFHTYFVFIQIFGYTLGLSLLFYVLRLSGLYSPEMVLKVSPDGREYYSYPFNVMSNITVGNAFYLSSGFYRFHSFMGEPGWIGTLSGLVLLSLKFQFSQFKILYAYLLAALLSMSLGAYIPIFVGFIYFYFGKRLLYAAIPITVFFIFNKEMLDRFIFNRITVENGELAGDNRTNSTFDYEWNKLLSTPEVIVGKGKDQHTNHGEGVSSWKTLVFNGGIIGLFLYLMIFISIFFTLVKTGNKKFALVFFFVFLMTIYHRPRIQYVYFLIILYGGLLYNEFKSKYLKTLKK